MNIQQLEFYKNIENNTYKNFDLYYISDAMFLANKSGIKLHKLVLGEKQYKECFDFSWFGEVGLREWKEKLSQKIFKWSNTEMNIVITKNDNCYCSE